jgi:hypothetical protein
MIDMVIGVDEDVPEIDPASPIDGRMRFAKARGQPIHSFADDAHLSFDCRRQHPVPEESFFIRARRQLEDQAGRVLDVT